MWSLILSHQHGPDVRVAGLEEADEFLRILRLLLRAVLAVSDDDLRECSFQLLAQVIARRLVQHAHDLPEGEKLRNSWNFLEGKKNFRSPRYNNLVVEQLVEILRRVILSGDGEPDERDEKDGRKDKSFHLEIFFFTESFRSQDELVLDSGNKG